MKNIPIPSKLQYQKQLVSKVDSFVNRIRWKMFYIQNPNLSKSKETYGFKSNNSPPQCKELKPFEDDLFEMISNIKYKPVKTQFQNKLREDCQEIRNSSEIIVSADKTSNLYKLPPEEYKRLLINNVTKEYKKCTTNDVLKTNKDAAKIAQNLNLEDRIEALSESQCFITIKDHKENFPGRIECRLINPAKTNIGVISKQILEKINKNIRTITVSNQWRNTNQVLDWFKNLENKDKLRFFQFDIVSFYPSISETLFLNAIEYAKSITEITKNELEIMIHSRRSFLFTDESPWKKKDSSNFDVTMGSFDGAEVCEMVGLFLLHQLEQVIPKQNIGLYRDDGLAVVENNGPKVEQLRKKVIQLFQRNGLKVKIETNISTTNFLDVTLDLKNENFKPFRKENDKPQYINKHSNHPPNIKKELPEMIKKRLSELSSSEELFNSEVTEYDEALKAAGYSEKLQYIHPDKLNNNLSNNTRRSRKRKIIWFNPPYNECVSSNLAKNFLKLIDKHFDKTSPLKKYFNKNTVKVSYSCMPNMISIITSHNRKILNTQHSTQIKGCNCRGGTTACPLDGKCLTESLIYKAIVKAGDQKAEYIGLASTDFKTRYNNHNSSFKNSKQENSTGLSKHVWNLKRENKPFEISWFIASLATPYKKETNKCQLCLTEKTLIILADKTLSLNKRHEIMSKCRHKNKMLLVNVV